MDITVEKINNFLDKLVNYLVIFFLFLLIFESIGNNAESYEGQLFIIDFFISLIFAFEYFFKFYFSKNKLKFTFNFMKIIDLLSFAPFFLLLIVSSFIIQVSDNVSLMISILVLLRLLRILKVLRLLEAIPLTSGFLRSLVYYIPEYKAVFILFFVVLYIASFLVYYFEHGINPDLDNMLKALWWSLVTITTVGYGDVVPVTIIGKVCASVFIFLGPLILGIFSAITVLVFMETAQKEKLTPRKKIKLCKDCYSKNIKDAKYCINCGYSFVDNTSRKSQQREKI